MEGWYSWLLVFKLREGEALSRWKQASTKPRRKNPWRAGTPRPLRAWAGVILIHLGEAMLRDHRFSGASADGC
jgi:hypothetical protein